MPVDGEAVRAPRRAGRWLGTLTLAAAALAGPLFILDRAIDYFDLNYQAGRSRVSDDRMLTRKEFSVRVTTNALGFREPRLPGPKPPGTIRIVALGDSFTQGYGVAEAEAYPRRLEALLRARDHAHAYEVFNLGVPGTNPRDYLGNLRAVGLAYEPDIVLVGVMGNDVQDVRVQYEFGTRFQSGILDEVRREITSPRASWKRLPSLLFPALYPFVWERVQSLRAKLAPPAAPRPPEAGADESPSPVTPPLIAASRWREVLLAFADRYQQRAAAESRLGRLSNDQIARIRPLLTGEESPFEGKEGEAPYWSLMALVQPDIMNDSVLLPPDYDASWERMIAMLRQIEQRAAARGARTIVVFVPAIHQVTLAAQAVFEERGLHWDPRTLTDTTFVDRLAAFGASSSVTVVDLLRPLRAQASQRLYFPEDGHWTPAGHELAAELLADAIRDQRATDKPR